MRTTILTSLALVAFAANSVLCRLVLGPGLIDAASFSSIRLASGAIVLWLIMFLRGTNQPASAVPQKTKTSNPFSIFHLPFTILPGASSYLLSLYAYAFSFSYLTVSTGTGALILFTSVQLTMIFWSLRSGHRVRATEWTGIALALGGLVYLTFPGLSAPDPIGAALMALAGVAWGAYTIRGRGADNPIRATQENFVGSLPFVVVISLLTIGSGHYTREGMLAASVSGGITSGLGYVVWYAALRGLTTVRAAVVQLSVPVIAAAAGILILDEPLTLRLMLASVAILGGIFLAFGFRRPQRLSV